jgi:hypothetical protein
VIVSEVYAPHEPSWVERAMAAECAAIGQEFPGWTVTWTPMRGFRAAKDGDEIGPSSSMTAVRCLIAVAEYRSVR